MTSIDWRSYAEGDAEFDALARDLPKMPELDSTVPIAAIRGMVGGIVPGESVPFSSESVKKSEISIPVRDGSSIKALMYQPKQPPSGGSQLLVAYHGGGWMAGVPELEETNCVNAVQTYGVVALSVHYRLAPEHPFPIPVEDSWDALKWIAANAATLDADPAQGFVIHGESAGGNIACVLAHLARDENLSPPLTGVSVCIPPLVVEAVLPPRFKADFTSREQNKDAPGFNSAILAYMYAMYKADVYSARFNPLNWPTGHENLPPTFVQACGKDPLRDDALLYERMLREEYGVPTRLVVYPGVPHSVWTMFPQMEASRKAVRETLEGFGWLLGKPD